MCLCQAVKMNAVPGFFASLFGELLLDNDCDNIENDPKADPIEKEICRSFRQFSHSFQHFEPHMDQDEGSGLSAEDTDPQSLRDSILSRPEHPGYEHHVPPGRQRHSRADRDLDTQVEADPALLKEYLGRDQESSPTERPQPHFRSSYSSVVITRRPDGSYEERRTVRDSDGNEEVTVTRSDGSGSAGEDWRKRKSGSRFDKLSDWFWPKRS